ncbi:hypothetical protein L195_g047728 [Trifolium pratense]|uniref:Uncharacterized protein n=1 Tax=Trifolium pratense TaxID=57577 RepID=A0A2K3MLA8_TRIPR|nr:hypothetical protein L195_g041556 [Trifolium pratense]PNX91596.1 hypothetical protein L195_g047727 [Trifolium pratense]PNX91597.1 hypothetical protein L195_g047728 [Trifolium pratense]
MNTAAVLATADWNRAGADDFNAAEATDLLMAVHLASDLGLSDVVAIVTSLDYVR